MPFGLSKAPATFQSLMNWVFKNQLRRFVLIFFDDILVYSKDSKAHEQHLKEVITILVLNQLYTNTKKCHFEQTQIEYLGHLVSAEGVAADPDKIAAMVHWPTP